MPYIKTINSKEQTNCKNIFTEIPRELQNELIETIIKKENITINRIVSNGHTTDKGEWYDQSDDEWVIVIQGEAILTFEKNECFVKLMPGDYLFIPAHTRHRVEWTLPEYNTIWLAIHL